MREVRDPSLAAQARRERLAVAVDGPAGAGKTTIGLGLGVVLDVPVLDTGLMYRAVTRAILGAGDNPQNNLAAVIFARGLEFDLAGTGRASRLLANGDELRESDLHQPQIDREVPVVAANGDVRSVLVEGQRRLASDRAMVMLGRDIGTVVLPEAKVKLYLTADAQTRAIRRENERPCEPGLLDRMHIRDQADTARAASPLRPAHDAILLDSAGLSIPETLEQAVGAVRAALSGK